MRHTSLVVLLATLQGCGVGQELVDLGSSSRPLAGTDAVHGDPAVALLSGYTNQQCKFLGEYGLAEPMAQLGLPPRVDFAWCDFGENNAALASKYPLSGAVWRDSGEFRYQVVETEEVGELRLWTLKAQGTACSDYKDPRIVIGADRLPPAPAMISYAFGPGEPGDTYNLRIDGDGCLRWTPSCKHNAYPFLASAAVCPTTGNAPRRTLPQPISLQSREDCARAIQLHPRQGDPCTGDVACVGFNDERERGEHEFAVWCEDGVTQVAWASGVGGMMITR